MWCEKPVLRTVSRRQLDSLFGYLNFCSTVVFAGRAFQHGVRRLRFHCDGALRAARQHVHVNAMLRVDLASWECVELYSSDGRVPMVAAGVEHEQIEAYIDRGGSGGVGMFVGGGILGLTGEECNKLFPGQVDGVSQLLASPGVRREVNGGRWVDDLVSRLEVWFPHGRDGWVYCVP